MLDLRRLRLLHELHRRGTVGAVAEALSYSPSTVSQQLRVLEREAGTPLFEPAGRRVRLTDAALVLVEHAERLLADAERAEADLAAAAAGAVAGRRARRLVPDRQPAPAAARHGRAARDAPRRPACGSSRPSPSRRWRRCARTRSTSCSPTSGPARRTRAGPGSTARTCSPRPSCSRSRTTTRRPPRGGPVPLAELAGEPWATGYPGGGMAALVRRVCNQHGGFEPDVRHQTNELTMLLALVAAGHAVTLLPELALRRRPRRRRGPPVAGAELDPHAVHRRPRRGRPPPRARRRPRGAARRRTADQTGLALQPIRPVRQVATIAPVLGDPHAHAEAAGPAARPPQAALDRRPCPARARRPRMRHGTAPPSLERGRGGDVERRQEPHAGPEALAVAAHHAIPDAHARRRRRRRRW